mmetsp:Transcript_17601/g.52131  ORF Transcript_17601/g.52131 Transcript_17601/m.52131 type:complete len:214 (-) Transcript_17601:53-694(-)
MYVRSRSPAGPPWRLVSAPPPLTLATTFPIAPAAAPRALDIMPMAPLPNEPKMPPRPPRAGLAVSPPSVEPPSVGLLATGGAMAAAATCVTNPAAVTISMPGTPAVWSSSVALRADGRSSGLMLSIAEITEWSARKWGDAPGGGSLYLALMIASFAPSSKGCLRKHRVYRPQPSAQTSPALPTTLPECMSSISGVRFCGVVLNCISSSAAMIC